MATEFKTERIRIRVTPDMKKKIKILQKAGIGDSMSEILRKGVDLLCELEV